MLPSLLEQLAEDAYRASLPKSLPEITLAATIAAMLLARIVGFTRRVEPFWIALAGAVVAAWFALGEAAGGLAAVDRVELYDGMLVHDGLGVYARALLLGFTVLLVMLSRLTGLANREDGQDYFSLVFGAVLGMCLMCRANHLMTVFLSVEMASVPSYVLVGVVRGGRRAAEAALKYVVYGGAAAGVMLYGVSLLAGLMGTAHLPTIATRLAALSPDSATTATLAVAAALVLVGMAFKLSVVPFHFWAPDVFAGATAEVGAFLSVASKTASLVLLVRLVAVTAGGPEDLAAAPPPDGAARLVAESSEPTTTPSALIAVALAIAAAVTCTVGNLAAIRQTNAKRLLAYSTIAHAGYLLMPIAAAVAVAPRDPAAADAAIAAVLLYVTGYLLLNTTAFAAVAILRNTLASETLADYAGLIRSAPVTAVCLSGALLGLLGLPPLIGFVGKLGALRALVDVGGPVMVGLLLVALANTAISLTYYLRVVRLLCLDDPQIAVPAPRPPRKSVALLALTAAPIVVLGVAPETVARMARDACAGLFG